MKKGICSLLVIVTIIVFGAFISFAQSRYTGKPSQTPIFKGGSSIKPQQSEQTRDIRMSRGTCKNARSYGDTSRCNSERQKLINDKTMECSQSYNNSAAVRACVDQAMENIEIQICLYCYNGNGFSQ